MVSFTTWLKNWELPSGRLMAHSCSWSLFSSLYPIYTCILLDSYCSWICILFECIQGSLRFHHLTTQRWGRFVSHHEDQRSLQLPPGLTAIPVSWWFSHGLGGCYETVLLMMAYQLAQTTSWSFYSSFFFNSRVLLCFWMQLNIVMR